MMMLDMQNPEYLEITKRTRILKPEEIVRMSYGPEVHDRRKEIIAMFPETGVYEVPLEKRQTWTSFRTVGDVVRNLLQKGQSVAELLDAMVVPANTKAVKIVAWKYDAVFDAFLIKRVNALCDVYHFYTSILQLPVQDLKELAKLPLRNPTNSERGKGLVTLLEAGVERAPCFLSYRCEREDKAYFKEKNKKRKSTPQEDKYLEEFSDKYFDKVTEPGLKVITGTQSTKPILDVFYHEEDRELKIIRNADNTSEDAIELFGAFELKLLHPSYISFLRTFKMKKVKDEVCEIDRRHFEQIIEVIAAAIERITFRKALAYSNLEKTDIKNIDYMRITTKGALEVVSKDEKRPHHFYAHVDFAGLTRESLVRLSKHPIEVNPSNEVQARLREKFLAAILQAIQDADNYKEKPVFNIKEEEEYY